MFVWYVFSAVVWMYLDVVFVVVFHRAWWLSSYILTLKNRTDRCGIPLVWLCPVAADRVVEAVGLSGLPYARGRLHQPCGHPASHALPRSTRTDEVSRSRPGIHFWSSTSRSVRSLGNRSQRTSCFPVTSSVWLPPHALWRWFTLCRGAG